MSYKKLEVWQLARDVSIGVHRVTIDLLPKLEMYDDQLDRLGGKLNL